MFSSTLSTDTRSVVSSVPNLKPSLKISTSGKSMRSSQSCTFVPALRKNVRFAADLTRVKSFHENDKPISISSETSPELLPRDSSSDSGCDWFNNDAALAVLLPNPGMKMTRMMKSFSLDSANGASARSSSNGSSGSSSNRRGNGNSNGNGSGNCGNDGYGNGNGSQFRRYSDITLGSYDYDCDLDDFDSCSGSEDDEFDYFYGNDSSMNANGKVNDGNDRIADFEIKHWKLTYTSIPGCKADDLLCGQEIKLGSIVQEGEQLVGLIYVSNLCYEKFVEVKYTFTNWSDIHYVTATYSRSVNDKIDEFRFTINLDSLDYFLKYKKILYCNPALDITVCPLSVDLCCRYYVNGQTYYDNNHSQNYQLSILTTTMSMLRKSGMRKGASKGKPSSKGSNGTRVPKKGSPSTSFYADFLVSTTLSHRIHLLSNNRRDPYARKFSEDTDYFNTSPYKHLYHNDTTLIRPTRLNKVLNSCTEDDVCGASSSSSSASPLPGAEERVSSPAGDDESPQSSLMSRDSSTDSMSSDMLAGISSSSSVTSSPVCSGVPPDDFTDLAFDDFNSSFRESRNPYKLLANPLGPSLATERLCGYKKSMNGPLDGLDPLLRLSSTAKDSTHVDLADESDTDDENGNMNPLSFVADYYNDAKIAPLLGGFDESDIGCFNDNQSVLTDTPILTSRGTFYDGDGCRAGQGNNSTDTLVLSDKRVPTGSDGSGREVTIGCSGRPHSPASSTCSSSSGSSTSSFYSANMTPSDSGLTQSQRPGTICTSMSGATMNSFRSRAEPNCSGRQDPKRRFYSPLDADYQTLLESYCFYTSERNSGNGTSAGVRGGGISITDEGPVRSIWKCSSPPMSLDYLRNESPSPVPIH